MRSTILSFNFTMSDHTALFPYPLQLDLTKEYEASRLSMEADNNLFNITEKNNKFSYNPEIIGSLSAVQFIGSNERKAQLHAQKELKRHNRD